ncbi:hypothetical protein [Bacillus sp. FJAT-27264]|nr:hypothetical protein [Bacillus sp. FJAT-27264]
MMEEIVLKNMPGSIKSNPNVQQKWIRECMDEMLTRFNSLQSDDAFVQ